MSWHRSGKGALNTGGAVPWKSTQAWALPEGTGWERRLLRGCAYVVRAGGSQRVSIWSLGRDAADGPFGEVSRRDQTWEFTDSKRKRKAAREGEGDSIRRH